MLVDINFCFVVLILNLSLEHAAVLLFYLSDENLIMTILFKTILYIVVVGNGDSQTHQFIHFGYPAIALSVDTHRSDSFFKRPKLNRIKEQTVRTFRIKNRQMTV